MGAATSLPRLPHARVRSAHALVTHDIALRILRGEYEPDTFLPPEADLIDRYGVSRTALREALKTLAAKGLLVSKTKVGTRVLQESHWNMYDPQVLTWRIEMGVDDGFLARIVEVRQVLEPAAAALAAARRTKGHLLRMRGVLRQMGQPHHTRDSYAEADLRFHQEVLLASGNLFMQSFFGVIEAHILSSFAISAPVDSGVRHQRSVERHGDVLHAVERGDPQAAGSAMSEVIRESIENARGLMAADPVLITMPLHIGG